MRQTFLLSTLRALCALYLFGCGPQDPSADTAFLKAVRTDDLPALQQQLAQAPDLLDRPTEVKGLTPLHIAARHAEAETVAWLIEQGADLNAQDREGLTPLHWAAHSLHTQDANGLRQLLEAGADPTLKNDEGQDVWTYLLDRHPNRLWGQAPIALGFLLRHGYEPAPMVNDEGKTILHELAERCEAPEAMERLITEHNRDPNARDVNGWTPLHFAAKQGNYVAAEILLRHQADLQIESTRGVGYRGSIEVSEELSGGRKSRYQYPAGSTPQDVYKRRGRGRRTGRSLRPLFESYE